MKLCRILCFLFSFFALQAFGDKIDSLQKVVSANNGDSLQVKALIELSKQFASSDLDKSIEYAKSAVTLSEKINFKKGRAESLKRVGICYYLQGKYLETLDYWEQSLKAFKEINDLDGQSNILNNIGSIYYDQLDFEKALEYYLKSLRIAEQTHDKKRMASVIGNIGNVYGNKEKRNTWDQAIEYYKTGLLQCQLIDSTDKDRNTLIGSMDVGLGEVYMNKGDYKMALKYFKESLVVVAESEMLPYSLNDIGKLYTLMNMPDTAIAYHQKAYDQALTMDLKLDEAQSLLGIAKAREKQGRVKEALDSYQKAEKISAEIGFQDELKYAYEGLAFSYSRLADYKKAFEYQSKLTVLKDSLYNIATDKKVASLQFDFDISKKQGEIDLLTKDQALKDADLKRQKLIKNATIGGLAIVLLFLIVVFRQKKKITEEKKRSDELLLNILPEETAEELKATGTAKAKSFDMVTVMFTDFKNFTQASEKLSAEELVQEINYCYSEFDKIITKYGIEKIKTIGDSYMCAGGIPVSNDTHPVDVIKAGLEMQNFIIRHKEDRIQKDQPYFDLRLGIHTGPVVAGIVGIKKFAYDIWGDTVNTASRMESSGAIGKVNISGTTYELVKDKFEFTYRGHVEAKNKGKIEMYFVEGVVNS